MLLAAGATAQTTNGLALQTNTNPALVVTLQPGEIVGREQVIREFVRLGTNEFLFVAPPELRSHPPAENTIPLISGDLKYWVNIGFVERSDNDRGLKEALRERITSRYPNAGNREEVTTTVADHEATGFQFQQEPPGTGPRLIRILWVPFKAGVIEFVLNTDAKSVTAGRAALDMILLTFRSNERGSLEIVRRSDKS
jgi:hypothetical protein